MTNEQFIKEQNELLNQLPVEFRGTLSYMAYERGHSAGSEEIINVLNSLVYDLKPTIEEYTKRLLNK